MPVLQRLAHVHAKPGFIAAANGTGGKGSRYHGLLPCKTWYSYQNIYGKRPAAYLAGIIKRCLSTEGEEAVKAISSRDGRFLNLDNLTPSQTVKVIESLKKAGAEYRTVPALDARRRAAGIRDEDPAPRYHVRTPEEEEAFRRELDEVPF